MKPTILVPLALLAAVLQVQAQPATSGEGKKPGGTYYSPSYSGGGIRGNVVLAEGELLTPTELAELNPEGAEPVKQQRRRALVPEGPKPVMPILAPKGTKVSSPFALELAFPPEAAPASFRAYWGPQRIDITDRLVLFNGISETGVKLASTRLPPGKHQLVFEVKTPQGPVTSSLQLEVQ